MEELRLKTIRAQVRLRRKWRTSWKTQLRWARRRSLRMRTWTTAELLLWSHSCDEKRSHSSGGLGAMSSYPQVRSLTQGCCDVAGARLTTLMRISPLLRLACSTRC